LLQPSAWAISTKPAAFVVGKTSDGQWAELKTTGVET
jgi:hypothetical protein